MTSLIIKNYAKKILLKHEGSKNFAYVDTANPPKITIGVGRNLEDRGLSDSEIDLLLCNDIDYYYDYLTKNYTFFKNLSEARQIALVDMIFNLGIHGFDNFKKTISLLGKGDFEAASLQMLDSKWASQVGQRAKDLSNIIKTNTLAGII